MPVMIHTVEQLNRRTVVEDLAPDLQVGSGCELWARCRPDHRGILGNLLSSFDLNTVQLWCRAAVLTCPCGWYDFTPRRRRRRRRSQVPTSQPQLRGTVPDLAARLHLKPAAIEPSAICGTSRTAAGWESPKWIRRWFRGFSYEMRTARRGAVYWLGRLLRGPGDPLDRAGGPWPPLQWAGRKNLGYANANVPERQRQDLRVCSAR